MIAPIIKEALKRARRYVEHHPGTQAQDDLRGIDAALATLSPPAGERREAIARIIKDHVDYFLSDKEGPLKAADLILAFGLVQDEVVWRDISSAPKDGTFILAYNVSHSQHVVVGWTHDVGMPELAPHGCWTDVGNQNHTINYMVNQNYFQFWRPLPSPPIRSARDGGAES